MVASSTCESVRTGSLRAGEMPSGRRTGPFPSGPTPLPACCCCVLKWWAALGCAWPLRAVAGRCWVWAGWARGLRPPSRFVCGSRWEYWWFPVCLPAP